MSDIIERLKNNKEAFSLMPQDMQDKAKDIGVGQFREFLKEDCWIALSNLHAFRDNHTYRLRPDYAENPNQREIPLSECKIKMSNGKTYLMECFIPQVFLLEYEHIMPISIVLENE